MKTLLTATFTVGAALALSAGSAASAAETVIKNRSIGYIWYEEYRGIYETPDHKECPDGFNTGPTEQIPQWTPGGNKTVLGTQLDFEGEVLFPGTSEDRFPFHLVQGKTSYGLNLDGKVGPNDFTSPEGVPGIDNQFYRVMGCVFNYRREGNTSINFPLWRSRQRYNAYVIELTDVDSLVSDPDVTVTTYRGGEYLLTDATGNGFLPGGTQTIDTRWGKKYIQKFHGKIEGGVLTSEAKDLVIPNGSSVQPRDGMPDIQYYDMRFSLKLSETDAVGFLAGYVDIESFIIHSHKTRSTVLQMYGRSSLPSIYRQMLKFADGHPDPVTGANTAISSAIDVKFKQVFVKHSPGDGMVSAIDTPKTLASASIAGMSLAPGP